MKQYKKYILFILIITQQVVMAQQQPLLSQYAVIPSLFNPAMTGYSGKTNLSLASRYQWVGIDKAPRYTLFCGETRFKKKSENGTDEGIFNSKEGRVGLGFSLYNDRNGHFDRTGFQFSYAYHVMLQNYNQLSFGITASAFQMRVSDKDMTFRDPSDQIILNGINKVAYIPDANIGVLISGIKYYAGASIGQLFKANVKFGNENMSYYQVQRCYYLTGGYFVEIPNTTNLLEPTILIKSNQQFSQAEIGFNFHKTKAYWVGLSYRSSFEAEGTNAIIRLGGFFKKVMICYAYDLGFSAISKYNYGTHELIITYHYNNVYRQRMKDPY